MLLQTQMLARYEAMKALSALRAVGELLDDGTEPGLTMFAAWDIKMDELERWLQNESPLTGEFLNG